MKNNIRSLSIKIVSLISAFMVLFTCLIIPAAATENNPSAYQPTFIDLFSIDYEFKREGLSNGNVLQTDYVKDPSMNLPAAGLSVRFTWGGGGSIVTCNYVYVAIKASTAPDSVVLNNNYTGVLSGYSGGVYFYKFDFNGSTSNFSILINSGSRALGRVDLVQAYAIFDDSNFIDEVNVYAYAQMPTSGTGLAYEKVEVFNEAVQLPFVYDKAYPNYPAQKPAQFFVDVNFPLPTSFADSVSITFYSSNVWENYYDQDTLTYGGVSLYKNGSTQESLPYIVSDTVTTSFYEGYPMYFYTITVDLTGVDLDGAFLHFRTYLGEMERDVNASSNTHVFYHFRTVSVSYKLDLYNKPWYVRFFYWIQEEFASLKATIQNSLGVGETVPDISDQQQQIQDDVGGMDQIGGEMEDSREEMEELLPEMPSWEDTGLDGFDTIVGSYIQQIEVFFIAIYENVILSQILTYTFLFALGGFILFGERM